MTESNDSVGFVQSAVKVRVSIAQCQSASQVHEPYRIIGGSPVMRILRPTRYAVRSVS